MPCAPASLAFWRNGRKSLVLFQSKFDRATTVPFFLVISFAKLSATPLPKVSLSDQTASFVILSVSIAKLAMAGPWTVSGAAIGEQRVVAVGRIAVRWRSEFVDVWG